MRIVFAKISFVLSVLASLWLTLGILKIVPFMLKIHGETDIRAHASLAVFFLICATWGFWKDDHR
jgi:small neutral amino acid transporter SnatA (MarC family)